MHHRVYLYGLGIIVVVITSLFSGATWGQKLGMGRTAHGASSVRFVAPAALGFGDCSSWSNACTLPQALSIAVSGDQVWLQAGVYKPAGGRAGAFQLLTGVAIYGGFPITATGLFSERSPAHFVTVLSGDIDNNDIADGRGVVTDTVNLNGANSYHVVIATNVDATARLDGVTITAGQADAPTEPDNIGGGLRSVNADATLENVIFAGNLARSGGAIFADAGSDLTLRGLTLIGNRATDVGGGALHNRASAPSLTDIFFGRNVAPYGGALYNENSSPTIVNAVFSANQAENVGGAVLNQSNSNVRLVNATLAGNSAAIRGGGLYSIGSAPTLANVILWGNAAPQQPQVSDDITATTTITTSLVQGGWPGAGNLDADPGFVDADGADQQLGTADDDLRLMSNSPAINAGANAVLPGGVSTDLDGNPRIVQGVVDLGAYEFQLPVQTLTIGGAGAGTGEVLSTPGGITCLIEAGAVTGDCVEAFVVSTVVTLTATADIDAIFAGWTGCDSVNGAQCVVALHAGRIVTATFQALRTLGVGGAGSGTGNVSSAPGGIECTLSAGSPAGVCSALFVDGATITLTAQAATGSRFIAWGGCDSAVDVTCSVTMRANQSVAATFAALRTLTVSGTGAGDGVVSSMPAGIDCAFTAGSASGACSASFIDGAVITLTATPAGDATFTGWSGACSGVNPVVTVTLAVVNKSCTASFVRNQPATAALTITGAGDGSGVVTSTPPGINCTIMQGNVSGVCTALFTLHSAVTLTAIADAHAEFSGWQGEADCADGQLTLSAPRQCTATFATTQRNLYLPFVRRS